MGPKVLPDYGKSTLAEVLPAVAARVGIGDFEGVAGLELPEATRWVVVLVDGLGYRLLRSHLADAPYLADLFGDARQLTSALPSTTATSISSLGIGVPPGEHGLVGYTFQNPESGLLMNALNWTNGPHDVASFQPLPTMMERLRAAGVATCQVTLDRFDGSGLTQAALRGSRFVGVDPRAHEQRIGRIVDAAVSAPRTVTYVYEHRLDHTGHGKGTFSPAWRRRLTEIDALLEELRAALPSDVALLVTGDHGMVDVPVNERVVIDDDSVLMRGVNLVGGEARFRQLYTHEPDAVAQRWRDVLADRAWVATLEEAERDGWFGPISERVRPRFGQVLVAMRGSWAALSRSFPQEFKLVGFHGSMTPEETQVPLLVDHPDSEGWFHG